MVFAKKPLALLLALLLAVAVAPAPGVGAYGYATSNAAGDATAFGFDAQLDAAREAFLSATSDDAEDLEIVEIDTSRIIHQPQGYLGLEAPTLDNLAAQASSYAGPFDLGDTRDFRATVGRTTDRIVKGTLVAQGEYTNVWVLDDADYHAKTGTTHNNRCHLNDVTNAMAQDLADAFDATYAMMTGPSGFAPHSGVQIRTGYSNIPVVGDAGNDAKVNFLLYDLYGDGGSGSYVSGFFNTGEFQTDRNGLDLLHIDIGDRQGYADLQGSDTKLNVYKTMAHEFQHLLFYMYFGLYDPSISSNQYLWINEALSELAGTFFAKRGVEVADVGRLFDGAANEYGSGTGSYADFLNFTSMKNYGMGKLFSMHLYKKYGGAYTSGVYKSLRDTYPPATNYNSLRANSNKISADGHDKTVGRFLNAGTGIGNGDNTLPLVYFLFMEGFAADGGSVVSGGIPVPTTKLYANTRESDNLWAVRPALGTGTRISSGGSSYYLLTSYKAFPTIGSGGGIALNGYGTPFPSAGATHERFHKLSGSRGSSTPYLTISVSDPNANTRYYVVVPNAGSPAGSKGADVYALAQDGSDNTINTSGRDAYLFVATFRRNVSVRPTFSWSASAPIVAPPTPPTPPPDTGDPIGNASDWAQDNLTKANNAGLIPEGIGSAGWRNVTTRIDIAHSVVRLIEKTSGKTRDQIASENGWDLSESPFSDTDDKDVVFLSYADVVAGSGGRFSPNGTLNRAGLVTILGQVAEKVFNERMSGSYSYADANDIPVYARRYVAYAARVGIASGNNNNRFLPNGKLTNQQTVIAVYNTYIALKQP